MGIQIVGPSGTVSEVGVGASAPQHVTIKPIPYATLGHYRSAVRFVLATAQNANSRLWEVRNTHATNLIIPTRLQVTILPAGTVTTPYRLELDLFRVTGFSAVDTTNTVTPTASPKRASMAAAPGGAAIRHVTVAGAAAGMTGGTLTKDGGAADVIEYWAATAAATTIPLVQELLDDVNGTHPWTLVQNEGLLIENVAAGSATANVVSITVDFSWAEVTAF